MCLTMVGCLNMIKSAHQLWRRHIRDIEYGRYGEVDSFSHRYLSNLVPKTKS